MPTLSLPDFLARAWDGYSQLTPDAPTIHRLLIEKREKIVNDHVAFRTFNIPGIGKDDLGKVFEHWGYRRAPEELDFPDKKLKACYYLHSDPSQPKVFISELLTEKFPSDLQDWVHGFAGQAIQKLKNLNASHLLEQNWDPVQFEDYERFYPMSEYAAWTAAFGIRVNHFTVLVNSLRSFESLEALNEFLVGHGIVLNASGGVIKGTPPEYLEQSSTIARKIDWTFARSARRPVMGCYYEFARRYRPPGKTELFSGFIPKSADKIFESTFDSVVVNNR